MILTKYVYQSKNKRMEVLSNDNSLLLADDSQIRLRFQPNMDYMGGSR